MNGFEIFGRIILALVLTAWILLMLWFAGIRAGSKGWKAVGVGLYLWLMILGVTLGIVTVYGWIIGAFF